MLPKIGRGQHKQCDGPSKISVILSFMFSVPKQDTHGLRTCGTRFLVTPRFTRYPTRASPTIPSQRNALVTSAKHQDTMLVRCPVPATAALGCDGTWNEYGRSRVDGCVAAQPSAPRVLRVSGTAARFLSVCPAAVRTLAVAPSVATGVPGGNWAATCRAPTATWQAPRCFSTAKPGAKGSDTPAEGGTATDAAGGGGGNVTDQVRGTVARWRACASCVVDLRGDCCRGACRARAGAGASL